MRSFTGEEVVEQAVGALLEELKKEPKAYHAPRLNPEQLILAISDGRAVIRCHRLRIIAFAALWPTYDPNCLEIGTVWVALEKRGNGPLHYLMTEVVGLAPRDADLFLITTQQAVMRSAEMLGFRRITTDVMPDVLKWASGKHVVERVPKSVHGIAQDGWGLTQNGDRQLFMRRA